MSGLIYLHILALLFSILSIITSLINFEKQEWGRLILGIPFVLIISYLAIILTIKIYDKSN